MAFQSDPGRIVWRVRIAAPVERVYDALATDAGRAAFWSESAVERGGVIAFVFPDGTRYESRILRAQRPGVFAVEYFGSAATFTLTAAGEVTEVLLVHEGVAEEERPEVTAGWVSVLLQLKAAVQCGIDLRNHDRSATWAEGYVEN